ncbi:MAG TPA: iron ABC transporter permease [Syntrophorhabdaceae bacterium]|nr:MAG: putative ABC transporter permease protein [Deltaproteobacteria bacterium ADurb.Bin135]HNQ63149.1 iron ABC transporter permease [Syntrophorhabdaceae bacterium]HNZ58939.1 iron ABC transporter permease [Syntrophorhabdaceae bacterium]HOB69063.1 iron ABC transporter permease [Syntrophorhabdaceae bacterium]HOG40027.1 iron ABC transporter permease [Syntrophorhabdaceae bacterium]
MIALTCAILVFMGVVAAALTMGRYAISPGTLFEIISSVLTGKSIDEPLTTPFMVLFSVRLPRVIIAAMVGAALSVSGAVFQGLFRNPLVSPGILGVGSGASFGATLAIFFAGNTAWAIGPSAFLWGLIAVFLAYHIGRRGGNSVTSLVLAGVIISALFTAAVSFLKYKADPYNQLPAIVFWTMGSFNSAVWADTVRSSVLIATGLICVYVLRWWLNPMALGDEDASTLGINVPRARFIYIFITTLMVAASVSVCGNIGWVGLVVPHMARIIVGSDHDALIPFSALSGGIFMLVMDTLARILPGGEIPVGILTSLIGAPFFAYLLITNEQKGAWHS